jgi:hypothetical protein
MDRTPENEQLLAETGRQYLCVGSSYAKKASGTGATFGA